MASLPNLAQRLNPTQAVAGFSVDVVPPHDRGRRKRLAEEISWLILPQELQLVLLLETTGRSTLLASCHRMFAPMQDLDLYK